MTPVRVSLLPDADEARRWAERELADPSYQVAQPTPFDRVAHAVGDAVVRFFSGSVDGGWGPAFAVIATVVVLALVLVAFLIWGRPRSSARMRIRRPDDLFGAAGPRSADAWRAEAERLAAAGEWAEATAAAVRALAQGLDERGLLETPPGTTVQAFARRAAVLFPDQAEAFARAAMDFDDVRYLHRDGTAAAYERVRDLDRRVSRAPAGAR